jgi:hypothetical protein
MTWLTVGLLMMRQFFLPLVKLCIAGLQQIALS